MKYVKMQEPLFDLDMAVQSFELAILNPRLEWALSYMNDQELEDLRQHINGLAKNYKHVFEILEEEEDYEELSEDSFESSDESKSSKVDEKAQRASKPSQESGEHGSGAQQGSDESE